MVTISECDSEMQPLVFVEMFSLWKFRVFPLRILGVAHDYVWKGQGRQFHAGYLGNVESKKLTKTLTSVTKMLGFANRLSSKEAVFRAFRLST